jgi:hypothetical protein
MTGSTIDISTPEAQEALANLCYHAAGVKDLNGFVDSSAENRLVWGYTPETQGLDVAENLGAILHLCVINSQPNIEGFGWALM